MTKPDDFGTEINHSYNRDYCRHCYESGALQKEVTMDQLVIDVQKLIDIEAAHPNLLSTPMLEYIKVWLLFDDIKKAESMLSLHSELADGQDCDFTGTQWEQEWLADGKVCHCIACVAARKCISDIKLMATNDQ